MKKAQFCKLKTRALSLALAVLILLPLCSFFSFAESGPHTILPCIYFRGNSEPIVDENGTQVYDFDVDMDQIKDLAKTVLPLFLKGLVTNNFDDYYRTFGEEMSKIYDRCRLDESGNPRYGTGISQGNKDSNAYEMTHDKADGEGRYDMWCYCFRNDWRLDPLKTVEDVNTYIDAVLAVTGKEKVNLVCKCLGGDLILTYLAVYGWEKINGVGFGSTVAFGGEEVDDMFSGNMNIDPDQVERFMQDRFMQKELKRKNELLYNFLLETVTLAQATGALKRVSNFFMKNLYAKLYEGLTPELVLAMYGTWPGYWAMVTPENYQSTRDFIFGKPGSERYTKYAALIEKLDAYDATVRQRIPEVLMGATNDGVKLAIVSKYGLQMPPILKSADETGDVWATTKRTSLGATTAKIGTTLDPAYVAGRKAVGYGKYISPDNIIDASTCRFPDNTWFIKGLVHDDWWNDEDTIMLLVFNYDGIATVDTFERYPQFLVRNPSGAIECIPMTEENMNIEHYPVNAPKPTFIDNLRTFFTHIGTWFRLLFDLLKTL